MANSAPVGKSALRNVLLFGATGQTGQAIVELLCGGKRANKYLDHESAIFKDLEASKQDSVPRKLTAITRRDFNWSLDDANPRPFGNFHLKVETIDFEDMQTTLSPKLQALMQENPPIEVAFCTHGTTRSKAGSVENFIKIDKDYTLEMARQCKAAGVKHFCLLASSNADAKSRFLYLRTKGEIIEEIKKMGFERLSVFKPNMLITQKREDSRFAESIVQCIDPFLSGIGRVTGIKSLEGIKVEDLAAAMISNAMTSSNDSYQEFVSAPDIIALKQCKIAD